MHFPLVIAASSCSTNDDRYRDEEEVCAALKLLIDAGANVNAVQVVNGANGAGQGFTALMQAVV